MTAAPTTPTHRVTAPTKTLAAAGIACVVLGGLVAAVTGPLDLALGSWCAAYLVLVGGVSQCAMAYAGTWPSRAEPPRRAAWALVGCWNGGNAVVIVGTLLGLPTLVDLGSIALVVALVLALLATRGQQPDDPASPVDRLSPSARLGATTRLVTWRVPIYRGLLAVLAVSIPIGMVLSALRND